MSKLKVTTISDPDNDNTAITVDTSGNVTFAQNATFSGTVSGIDSGAKTISDDDTATYSDGDYFVSSTGIAYRLLNDGTSSAWYEVGSKQSIPEINSVDTIAVGYEYSMYINQSGDLYGVGYNAQGQLGLGDTSTRSEWTKIASNVKKVFAGGSSTFFIKQDGTLWATGSNSYGGLGFGDTVARNEFEKVNITNVEKVASFGSHTLILKTDGSVWAVGINNKGQLGLGDTTTRSSLTQVVSSGVTDIAVGSSTSFYINSSGAVYSCGYNNRGQLGRGNTTDYSSFGITNITSGASRLSRKNGYSHSAVIKTDGSLWTTGDTDYGQLGSGSSSGYQTSFGQRVSSGAVDVSCAHYMTIYVNSSGTVYTTGINSDGQLGLGDTSERTTFTATSITNGVAVANTNSFSFVIKDDNLVSSTGNGANYKLGSNSTSNRTSFDTANVNDAVGTDQVAANLTVGQLA